MQRNDVLTGLSIRLGPALKIYERHVKVLQRTHFQDDEAFCWDTHSHIYSVHALRFLSHTQWSFLQRHKQLTYTLLHSILDFAFPVNSGTFQILVLKLLSHTHMLLSLSIPMSMKNIHRGMKMPLRHHCTLQSDKNKGVISLKTDWSCACSWDGCDSSAHELWPGTKFNTRCCRHVCCPLGGSICLEKHPKTCLLGWWWHIWGLHHGMKSDFVRRISHQRWTCFFDWTTFSFFEQEGAEIF